MDKMSQHLLKTFISGFGLEDDHIKHLNAASEDIKAKFIEDPTSLIPHLLISSDPDINSESQPFEVAEQVISTHWISFHSKYGERPINVLKYVMLRGVVLAGDEDPAIAAIAYMTLIDPVRLNPSSEFLKTAQMLLDHWQTSYLEHTKEAFHEEGNDLDELEPLETKLPQTVSANLTSGLNKAFSSQQHLINSSYPGPLNPEWIKEAVNGMVSTFTTALQSSHTATSKTLNEQTSLVKQVLSEAIKPLKQLSITTRKINLLWWMQARFSPGLQKRYRELEPWSCGVAMAEDLCRLTTHPAGPEIEAILEESLAITQLSKADVQAPLIEALQFTLQNTALLESMDSMGNPNSTRVNLSDGLRWYKKNPSQLSEDNIRALLGVPADTQVTPLQFAVWYFRTLSVFC